MIARLRFLSALALLLGIVASAPHGAPADDPAPDAETTNAADAQPALLARGHLGDAFVRFERAFFAHDRTPAETRRANEAFDDASRRFFRGDTPGALRLLNDEWLRLGGHDPADPRLAFLASLTVTATPPVDHRQKEFAYIQLAVRQQYPLDGDTAFRFGDALTLVAADGQVHWGASFLGRAMPGRLFEDVIVPDFRQKVLAAGRYEFQFRLGDVVVPAQRLHVTELPLAETKPRLVARLAALRAAPPDADDASPLAEALVIAAARLDVLSDDPSPDWSAQYVADHAALVEALERELDDLEQGVNPYAGRPGDSWRLLRADGVELPYRLYAPTRVIEKGALPLLVALHGAGGDENMWAEAYGAGRLHRLAEERGFLVAAPLAYPITRSPELLSRLVESIARAYDVDRDRVFLVGHSMGAMAAGAAASRLTPAPRAVAFLAGAPPLSWDTPGTVRPPVLLVAGALDPIIPAPGLAARAEKMKQAGHDVTYREEPDGGHTILVGSVLPDVVEWLLQQDGADASR